MVVGFSFVYLLLFLMFFVGFLCCCCCCFVVLVVVLGFLVLNIRWINTLKNKMLRNIGICLRIS